MTDFGTPNLLELLASREAAVLAAHSVRRHYHDGALVHDRGDPELRMGVVIKGGVKLMRLNRNGEIAFALTVRAGQNYGDTVALDRFERTHRAVAIGETAIDFLSADALYYILGNEPTIVGALYRVAAHRLVVAVDLIDDMRMLKIEARLAKYLLQMLDQPGVIDRIDCTQDDLAQFLGVSSVTIAKGLRILVGQGLVKTGYRRIVVPNPDHVQAWLAAQD